MNQPETGANKKQRLAIKTNVMRELMFASGGRCAMTNCGLSLISPSGGWVGTVAHIVAAEPGGPRGAGTMSAEDRRKGDNLILMCGTHGREVDDRDTGESEFPIDLLRTMKDTHEAKVVEAVAQAITYEATGVRTATSLLDTSFRSSTEAETAEGLAEMVYDYDASALVGGLAHARAVFQRLSQVGLDALAQILAVWQEHCYVATNGTYEFGDPSDRGPYVPLPKVGNRIGPHQEQEWWNAFAELENCSLLELNVDEDAQDYVFRDPWNVQEGRYACNFWISAAEFLYQAHGLLISEWARSLDFTVFDRPAHAGRSVPWR
ncbi:hypothetical protein GEV27_05385 [Aeromicrobium sp. S22]|uniref:hypothetical protein n=1 Tax=Aeromicrobium sp. S22 TaxID=2662029 RepID=UPI00129D314D|nr:hypothetical protein [Aeromicrobium sp. S22]MRK00950.1 hypothetical protein [Aeromicrobium sp. S22]